MNISVLHINSYLKDRTFYKGLFEEQIRAGNCVKVFTPVPYHNRGKADSVGEYVNVEECYHSYERFLFFSKQWKSIKRAEALYDFSKIDILHAHSMCTNGYVAYKLSKKYNIPYIITVRNGDLNNIYKKALYLRYVFNNIIKNSKNVIFLSESYKEDVICKCVPKSMRRELELKSIVIPNGIDNYWLDNKNIEPHIMHKPVRLIYAGEINRNKNIKGLIEASQILAQRGILNKITLVGEIKEKIMEPFIAKEGINYLGKVGKEDLLKIYRDNDIFVMASHKEAFGLVYVEAMSQALPIIYTKNQGFDKQFDEGDVGFNVNSFDSIDIADKIQKVLENYQEMSYRALAGCDRFRWERVMARYEEVYQIKQ